jgi:hypothetical protein
MKIAVVRDELHCRFVDKYQGFYPEEGRIRFFQNFGTYQPDFMMSHPRRQSAML